MAKPKKIMPCGFQLTGNLHEHWAHYERCGHEACKARHEETMKVKAMFAKAMRIRLVKPTEVK